METPYRILLWLMVGGSACWSILAAAMTIFWGGAMAEWLQLGAICIGVGVLIEIESRLRLRR